MNNKAHLRPQDYDSNGDIIPMSMKEEKGDLVSNAPTVYPICEDKACKYRANERPQGEWIKTEWGYFCDQCGIYAFLDRYEQPIRSDFCPNCGAKMQKGGAE